MKFDLPAIGSLHHERSIQSTTLRTATLAGLCARQQFEVIKTVERLEERLAHITTPLTLDRIAVAGTTSWTVH